MVAKTKVARTILRGWFYAVIVVFLLLQGTPSVSAHPGRTDSNGGHTCRTNCSTWGVPWGLYHTHGNTNPPKVRTPPDSPPNTIPKGRPTLDTDKSDNVGNKAPNNAATDKDENGFGVTGLVVVMLLSGMAVGVVSLIRGNRN